MISLTRTPDGPLLERGDERLLLSTDWDDLFRIERLVEHLGSCTGGRYDGDVTALKPVGRQEVWAAGITYFASREARIEESSDAGSADVYERCYHADRPELFLKATPHRAVGDGESVRIRSDSRWNVPEPELVLAITAHGEVFGHTIGNDMSSRDIEGENPLYLPQAKIYDGCAAIGPAIVVRGEPPPAECAIAVAVERDGSVAFSGSTTVSRIRRTFEELVEHLWRDNSFPDGCLLMTGTGIVPPPEFTLEPGDVIAISIDGIGTLRNTVARGDA